MVMRKISGLAVCCAGIAVFFTFITPVWSQEATPAAGALRPVKLLELRHSDERRVRVFPGEVRASEQVDLAFRVTGTLHEVSVMRGARVKEGDLIAVLDKRDFESELKKVESTLQAAEAQLNAMKTGARREDVSALTAQVNASRAKYNEARISLDRYESLLKAGAVSRADHDRVKALHDVAREDLKVAEQNLAKGRAGSRAEEVEMQEAQIRGLKAQLKAAQDALNDTELRAPFDGTIAEKYIDNFQAVKENQAIVALQDIYALEVVVSIPGRMVLSLSGKKTGRTGENANLYVGQARFPSLPDRLFNLRFREVATKGNIQAQTYDVTLVMENPDDIMILPGMGVDVLLSGGHSGAVPQQDFPVPLSAVGAGEGNTHHVWKVSGREGALTVHKTAVKITGYLGDHCLVSGDLTESDKIVVAGLSYLHDGDPIVPYTPPTHSTNTERQP